MAEESQLCGLDCSGRRLASEESSVARRHWETIEEIWLGVGVIGTTLSQPMPRLSQRLAEYAAAKPAGAVIPPQHAYVMVSCFVAKTRTEAHTVTRENWRDTDAVAGLAYMKSLGIDPARPDFATGAVGWMARRYRYKTYGVQVP